MSTPSLLETKNPDERDTHITFTERGHIYTIDGDDGFMSVTTWNHSHFDEFDADRIIDNMMRGKNWHNSDYYGMTKDEIKAQWEKNRDEAAFAGTNMHYDIECDYNELQVKNDSIEYRYFNDFKKDYPDLTPFRSEWMIWDKELRFAGSMDMVFINNDGDFEIYDWKRSKNITKDGRGKKSKTECISHIPDANYWHYSLQLNTYKAILEKNYGKKVSKMCLICLHPNNENKSYIRYEVPDLSKEIKDLFNVRIMQLTDKDGLRIQELRNERRGCIIKVERNTKMINKITERIKQIDMDIDSLQHSATNTDDNSTEEDVEVTSHIYNNEEYLVDENTSRIYMNTGECVGRWIQNKPILFCI